jgi:hypothetical protein
MIRLIVVAIAVLAAIVPTPAAWVESTYSLGFYPALQNELTPLANAVPFALLDPLGVVISIVLLVRWTVRMVRPGAGNRRLRSALGVAGEIATTGAVCYLLFLVSWGLNYRRVPLAEQLAFDAGRVSSERLLTLATEAVVNLNALYRPAHARGWPPLDRTGGRAFVDRYAPGFERTLGQLRASAAPDSPIVPAVPKWSILNWYFRRAGIDGMTNPYLLEIIVNDDLLPFERPFVISHEWAHVAGYAAEDEASFVGWLTCLRGDEASQYSAWLFLYPYALDNLRGQARAQVARGLADGPRGDLRAVRERLNLAVPVVQQAAGRVYDRFLKANRVSEGVESYDRVVMLVLGTQFDTDWTPILER